MIKKGCYTIICLYMYGYDPFEPPYTLSWNICRVTFWLTWAYRIARPLSSRMYVCVYIYVNIFKHLLLWSHWADWSQISYGSSLGLGGTKVCSNGPGHMTKMIAMPIYSKNVKKFSSPEPKGRWPWNLVCSIGCSSTTKFVQMMTLGWPWPILRQGQIWSLMLLYGKKVKQWIFQKLLLSMIWN